MTKKLVGWVQHWGLLKGPFSPERLWMFDAEDGRRLLESMRRSGLIEVSTSPALGPGRMEIKLTDAGNEQFYKVLRAP